jgi:hypothetical protein
MAKGLFKRCGEFFISQIFNAELTLLHLWKRLSLKQQNGKPALVATSTKERYVTSAGLMEKLSHAHNIRNFYKKIHASFFLK